MNNWTELCGADNIDGDTYYYTNTCGVSNTHQFFIQSQNSDIIIHPTIYIVETINTTICSSNSIFLGGGWQNTTGTYYDTVYVSPTTDSVYITLLNVDDITFSEIEVSTCDTYTVPSGDETYTESGIYIDTIPNLAKCDSIMTIYLNVMELDTSVTIDSPTLTSNAENAIYQWIDCETMQAIPGETNQSFTAIANGNYAVIITEEAYADTSACYQITSLFVLENDFGIDFNVYPNPTTGTVVIDLGTNYSSICSKIRNVNSLLVSDLEFENSNKINLKIEGAIGYYFIEIVATGYKKAIIKVLKE